MSAFLGELDVEGTGRGPVRMPRTPAEQRIADAARAEAMGVPVDWASVRDEVATLQQAGETTSPTVAAPTCRVLPFQKEIRRCRL